MPHARCRHAANQNGVCHRRQRQRQEESPKSRNGARFPRGAGVRIQRILRAGPGSQARRQPRTEPVCSMGSTSSLPRKRGAKIAGWLGGVADSKAPPAGRSEPLTWAERVDQLLKARCAGLMPEQKAQVAARLKEIAGTANYRTVTDEGTLMAIYNAFKEESA